MQELIDETSKDVHVRVALLTLGRHDGKSPSSIEQSVRTWTATKHLVDCVPTTGEDVCRSYLQTKHPNEEGIRNEAAKIATQRIVFGHFGRPVEFK